MAELSSNTKYITNQNEILSKIINIYMPHSKKLDFLVGYFYFSGFESIYEQIENKPMRILVGMDAEVDLNNCICELARISSGKAPKESNLEIRNKYYKSLVNVINTADNSDTKEGAEAFDLFLRKLQEGTLEVKKTRDPNHAKMYLFYNDDEMYEREHSHGCVLVGSSNFSFQGTHKRQEINIRLTDGYDFDDGSTIFEDLWKQSVPLVDKTTKDDFWRTVVKHTWVKAEPTPYLMYVRVLYEYCKENNDVIKTPSEITKGNIGGEFSDLQYQLDAIRDGITIVKKHSGCIISDVVGLGKSIIASCIAANLNKQVIIVCPPHLRKQWETYATEFGLKGPRIYTPGILQEAVAENKNYTDQLVIIDEAHRYRNENTEAYSFLHQLCAGNLVLLLTATPFNNQPSDIFSLIKLFQIPAKSTIQTVDDLGAKMYELVKEYKKLKKAHVNNKNDEEFKVEADRITIQIKNILNPILIRRTRIDLLESKKYKEDLKAQKIEFSDVQPPEEQTYNLGKMTDIYVDTLSKLTGDIDGKADFIGTKYEPLVYLKNDEKIIKHYRDIFDNDNFQQGQHNMASLMKHLIVRRFESSIYSFKMTVNNILHSMENTKQWYEEYEKVPLFKKGNLPDFDDLAVQVEETLSDMYGDVDEILDIVLAKQKEKGLVFVQKNELNSDFINDLNHDITLFKNIKKSWPESCYENDPKLQGIITQIKKSLQKEPQRKIIVFSEFKDTVNYLFEQMTNQNMKVLHYSSDIASETLQNKIRINFDAGCPSYQQKNDYDILVATDAISEGFSLHRAGTIYNYDIPYNPTRVIQRVGRINRINKKVFEHLNIYNFFPSTAGEATSHTREISTFKIMLIQAILGSDTKVLTSEEQISGYMTKEFKKAQGIDEELSWNVKYENELRDLLKEHPEIVKEAQNLPLRCRIGRKSVIKEQNDDGNELFDNLSTKGVLVFSRKGDSYKFAYADERGEAIFPGDETGLAIFKTDEKEKALKLTDSFYAAYKRAKDKTGISIYKPPKTDAVKAAENMLLFVKQQITDEQKQTYLNRCLIVVTDYDCLPVYVLKQIAAVEKNEAIELQFDDIKALLPEVYIDKLITKKQNIGHEPEKILLAEQMQ